MLPTHAAVLSVVCGACAMFVEMPKAARAGLWYCCANFVFGLVGGLTCRGHKFLGKVTVTGHLPAWSYAVFAPIHFAKAIFKGTPFAKLKGKPKNPGATEVFPGWWVGGRTADDVGQQWHGYVY